MSFEDYARQMYMKYRLSLAIAVIRNKPEDLSPEQYLAKLKENIERAETADRIILTSDFTFNDSDFNFDDNDDIFISHEFNNNVNKDSLVNKSQDGKDDDSISINLLQDFSASINEVSRNNNDVLIAGQYVIVNDVSTDGTRSTNSLDDVLKTLKDIDENEDRNSQNIFLSTQGVLLPPFNHINSNGNEENMDICDNFSNDNTDFIKLVNKTDTPIMVDEKIRANVEKNVKRRIELSTTDVKQTNELREVNNIEEKAIKNTYDMEVDMALDDIRKNQYVDLSTDFAKESTRIATQYTTQELNNYAWDANKEADNKTVDNNNADKNLNIATTNAIENTTEDTILYTLHDFTQSTSHISQSQCQNIEIPQAFIHGNRHKNMSDVNKENEDNNAKNYSQGLSQTPTILTVNSSEISYIIDQSGKTYAILQSIQIDKNTVHNNNTINNSKQTQAENHSEAVNKEHDYTNIVKETNKKDTEFVNMEDELNKEVTDSEVVPFKVVKELSKIKAYLSRKERRGSSDGCSSDSGYRSDSQSSYKCARLSDDWVPQSAHCLYDYITQCPLITVTQEIVGEISEVLGRLIDRLHEEEKYPPFLEQLLEKVDALLRETSRGTECFENILLDKDETIQRLLLLNKSTHILKFSIEKIANILEKTHSYLISKENPYELTSIDEVENLRYIFYILEIFLQMYVKAKDSTSQCTQSSQETKLLKRSSITEIWKRKWNPNVVESKTAGSLEKGCVLIKCGEVLNKIVVDCMEGYSLVSFAALQCFNLLQN